MRIGGRFRDAGGGYPPAAPPRAGHRIDPVTGACGADPPPEGARRAGTDPDSVDPGGTGPTGAGGGNGLDGNGLDGTRRRIRTGRNLVVAIAVGLSLGGLVLLTLLTVKATFLALTGAAQLLALWELSRAVATRGLRLAVPPVAFGGAAMVAAGYWSTGTVALAAFVLTVVVLLGWRLPGGADGYLRDVAVGVFAVAYLGSTGALLAAMLAPADGAMRVLSFVILTVCSDVGGYFAGILVGRHPMAPTISPKKTWEGFAGSAVACVIAGCVLLPTLLHGQVWQGVIAGAAAVVAATLGDLAESMIKRDLAIKDMGSVLPGHGGVLDRIDSLLITGPVLWLVFAAMVPVR